MKKRRSHSYIHPEGYSIIAGSVGVSIAVVVLLRRYVSNNIVRWIAILAAAIDLLIICFFRNPSRPLAPDDARIISPASGTIVAIGPAEESEYIRDHCIKIAIFLSVFNVHVNVVPASGEVVYVEHHPGKYLLAFHPKASELNERTVTAIRTPAGHIIVVRQIAGIVARRISTYIHQGYVVRRGEELGFIKFGSRVELFLPLSSRITAHVGDRVKVGETPLAILS